jgi:hypothetical protein
LWARWVDEHRVSIEYEWTGEYATIFGTEPIRVEHGRSYDFTIRLDPIQPYVEVKQGRQLLMRAAYVVADGAETVGRQDVSLRGAETFTGTIRVRRPSTPICDRLAR